MHYTNDPVADYLAYDAEMDAYDQTVERHRPRCLKCHKPIYEDAFIPFEDDANANPDNLYCWDCVLGQSRAVHDIIIEQIE